MKASKQASKQVGKSFLFLLGAVALFATEGQAKQYLCPQANQLKCEGSAAYICYTPDQSPAWQGCSGSGYFMAIPTVLTGVSNTYECIYDNDPTKYVNCQQANQEKCSPNKIPPYGFTCPD